MTEGPTPHVPPHRPSIIVPSSAKPIASAMAASAYSAFPAIVWRPNGAVVAALIGAALVQSAGALHIRRQISPR